MITWKEFKLFIKNLQIAFKREFDSFLFRHKVLELRRNYVPKYSTRTPEEHQAIRDSIRKDPSTCKHLKGGYIQSLGHKDFNVSFHTFCDGSRRIICNSCGKKWFKGQPDWEEALKMNEQSTNAASASEIVNQPRPKE